MFRKLLTVCFCLVFVFAAGCSGQPAAKNNTVNNNKEPQEENPLEAYADAVVGHALSVSAQIKIINDDLESTTMDKELKTAAIETNASVLRIHLGEAWTIEPPENLKDLHEEYLLSLEKINEGLACLEQWAKDGNKDALTRGQEIIAEGMRDGAVFAKQLNTEILVEQHRR